MILVDFNLKYERDTMTFCFDLFFVLSLPAFLRGEPTNLFCLDREILKCLEQNQLFFLSSAYTLTLFWA